MRKVRFTAAVLSLFALLSSTAPAQAEEDTPKEAARELMEAPPAYPHRKSWDASLAGLWMPHANLAEGGSVGIQELKARLARSYPLFSRLNFTPDLSWSLMQISAPQQVRLPDTLHAVSAGLRADYRVNGTFSGSLLVAPGLAGDFTRIRGNDLSVRYGLTGRYQSSERLTLLAGFIYQQGYHSTPFFPILGFIYRPDQQWTISVAAPRPGVSYAVRQDLRLNLGLEFSGGEYQLHEERLGAKAVRYQDLRLIGGVDFGIGSSLKGELAGGYAFDRKFEFYDRFDAGRTDVRVADGPFLRAALKGEW